MLETGDLLHELGRADITIKSKRSKKEICIFDLLEQEDEDFWFNDCENVRSYHNKLKHLHCKFKADLKTTMLIEEADQISLLDRINYKMVELQVMLNPKDEHFLFSRLNLPPNPRFYNDEERIKRIHFKCQQYFGIQREVHRMTKNTFKVFLKRNFMSVKPAKGKKKKNKHQLELPMTQSGKLMWELEPVKLIELIAALSQVKAFGKNTTRKDIYDFFEREFDVPLKNAESSLHQMKMRKSSPIRFLNELTEQLTEYMDK